MFACLAGVVMVPGTAPASPKPEPPRAYVRVSKRDPRYLELSTGRTFIPIGLNMIAPPWAPNEGEAFRRFGEWLDALAANRGNYIRVWLSNPFFDVEHEKAGVYDEARAARIDRMLAMCRERGIRVKMTMEHFRSIGGGRQPWADKPLHNVANGGTATSMADWLANEASREGFRRKIRWYAARFGSRPEVYGWELWNEINAVQGGDYLAWTEAMLPELHRAFPRNLTLQSLGSFDGAYARDAYRKHSRMAGNDLAQVHRYLDPGAQFEVCHGPMDVLAADAVREILSYEPGKPVILAESGAVEASHSGPSRLYPLDKQGILLHDVLFAPFFAGAAGPGQIWHWDEYVAKNDLWWHFGRFAEAIKGFDPVAESAQPSVDDHPRLRIYRLSGRRKTLLWLRDKQNTWQTELRDGKPPETLHGITVAVNAPKVRTYDPWTNRWTTLQPEDHRVTLPDFSRSLVVVLEGSNAR